MTQITTEVKTHVIITYAKAHHMITQKQYFALEGMHGDEQLQVDGCIFKASAILEVMNMSVYRATFPEKFPIVGQPYSQKKYPENRDGRSFIEKMAAWYERNSNKKLTAGYKFFSEHMEMRKNKDRKPAAHVFDPTKESWKEFQTRIA